MQLKSLKDTQNLSKNISNIISPGDIIFLYGEIGVGKTTFVRNIVNYLESKNKIKKSNVLSPTFNIVYDYNIGNFKILHYDLYRVKNYNDISQLGMFEISDDHIKIVDRNGKEFARGLSSFSFNEIMKIMGRQSNEIDGYWCNELLLKHHIANNNIKRNPVDFQVHY